MRGTCLALIVRSGVGSPRLLTADTSRAEARNPVSDRRYRYEKSGERATLDLAEGHAGVLTTGRRGGGRAELAADRGGRAGAVAVPADGLEAGPRGHRAEPAGGPEGGTRHRDRGGHAPGGGEHAAEQVA